MLRVDVRRLPPGGLEIDESIDPAAAVLEGLDCTVVGPVTVQGRLQAAEGGSYRWSGAIRASVEQDCRRCLEPIEDVLDERVDLIFSDDPELGEDPSVYPLSHDASIIDLGQAVREELVLRLVPFALCREDCRGLCPRCGEDLNAGNCRCAAAGSTS
jgi:uncharacterized protein